MSGITNLFGNRDGIMSNQQADICISRTRQQVQVNQVLAEHVTSDKISRFEYWKQQAIKRGIAFHLTYDDIVQLWQVPCTYCGSSVLTVSIDRIDNRQGYISNNITSCCGRCNLMKGKLSVPDFLDQCSKVRIFQQSKS